MYLAKLDVYNRAVDVSVKIYDLCQRLAPLYFCLARQIARSSISISSNIAEGVSRGTPREFIRFLHIARGSAYETYTQCVILEKTSKSVRDEVRNYNKELLEIIKMISGLIRSTQKKL